MIDFLNSPAFSIAGMPASWAELIGALLGAAMVVCNIRQIHWGWPLAFLSSLMYGFVFVDAKLFAESSLQVFFALTALWGWWQWLRGTSSSGGTLHPQSMSRSVTLYSIAFAAVSVPAIALFLSKYTTSDVPWWDAVPTVLSLVATYWLGKKYTANWPLWIVVNVISIGLFAYKGLWLTVGLYAVFAVMAAVGWRAWLRVMKANA
ncbi:MAG: nicotinamide mononucleotide transporter [Brachymonas sp.]|nr:nicotinamide mononucleotide transporter [Brachymonas sp.]